MNKIIFLVILLFPIFSYAEQCTDIEYNELKDMTQQSFDKEYCRVTLIMESNVNYLITMDTKKAWKDVDSCTILIDKIKRIYELRFKTTPKICTDKDEKNKAKEVWPDRIVD